MSMTTELINKLRLYADDYDVPPYGREIVGTVELLKEAADTIEELSAKLHASQMERSSQYYHGGWVPVDERLPEVSGYGHYFLCCLENGVIKILGYSKGPYTTYPAGFYYEKDGFTWKQNNNPVIAWRPLPEPYSPNNEEVADADCN